MEEAHGRREFEMSFEGEILDDEVIEVDISNTDSSVGFEEPEDKAINTN